MKDSLNSHSGKFVLRLDPEIHKAVKQKAIATNQSLNELCVEYIKEGLKKDDIEPSLYTKIISTAQKLYGNKLIGAMIFGSYARGEVHDNSDIDLLLVLDKAERICRGLYAQWDGILPDKISIHFAHLPEVASEAGSLWLECALNHKIIFDRQLRIKSKLEEVRGYITSGKVYRSITHGQGYWVRL